MDLGESQNKRISIESEVTQMIELNMENDVFHEIWRIEMRLDRDLDITSYSWVGGKNLFDIWNWNGVR